MKLILPVLILLLVSCSSDLRKPTAPDDLIPRDTMVLIMHDLVILEGHIEIKYQSVQNYHKLARKSGDKLLKDFKVSPDRFERSYDYYVGHQAELQGIYSEVLDSLNKEVNEMRAKGVTGMEKSDGPNVAAPF